MYQLWLRWVAHLRVRSGWVSVFVSHKPSLFRAKESSLNNDPNPYETKDMIESLSLYHFAGKLGCRSFQIFNNWISFNWLLRYFCNIKRRVSMSEVKWSLFLFGKHMILPEVLICMGITPRQDSLELLFSQHLMLFVFLLIRCDECQKRMAKPAFWICPKADGVVSQRLATGGAGGGCPGTNRNHCLRVILSFLGNYPVANSAETLGLSFSWDRSFIQKTYFQE